MNKNNFLNTLRDRLYGLPNEDIEKSVEYYSEIIDDRIEDGLSEDEAVAAVGTVEEIVAQTLKDTALPKLVKEKIKPNRTLRAWEIVLLVLGSPVWLPLLAAMVIILLAVYIVLWSVVISLYSVVACLAACGAAGVWGMVYMSALGNISVAMIYFGFGFICIGLAIFLLLGCIQVTKGVCILSKNILLGIKLHFIGKGDEN